ncbi:hypothetical protein CBP36_19665 (plasmid) [Acidovorax carolinensis]|jgi:hypothetical protein|uniref:Uncharacterized protein n=1 Tax=Acidovorax carolinensis TaxID=553814 RepID=A0A240UJ94_9BURK|nr:hypothetical protein [Acidovorax carolinensis]ART57124.1 hypothetical protein CBP35_19620 [Acidovorax carolinensis]ART61185.1 hypothetical protein CBP36_19665 [Acidovorax carolinensis]
MSNYDKEFWDRLFSLIQADDVEGIVAIIDSSFPDGRDALCWASPEDPEGRTPLMLAYWWGKAMAATALINCGSDYSQQDAKGRGAAWYAKRFGQGERELRLSNVIGAAVTRISMRGVLEAKDNQASATPPPKRRISDV